MLGSSMSSNENLLKNYENEKNQIKLDIEIEQENLKGYRNHRDHAAAVACKEKIGRLKSNLRNIEDKIAKYEKISKNEGVDPYVPFPVNNSISCNEIDKGIIAETYDMDVDIIGTKGNGVDKKDVSISQNQKIVRTSTIDKGNVVNQSTTVTNNKISSKSKKQISDKNDIVINVKPEDNEKELMDKFLNEYKNSRSINKSIQSAGISQSQYNSWCKSGRNKINKNATYFVNELYKLKRTSKPRKVNPFSKKDSFPKQDDYSKQYVDYYKQNNSSKQYVDYFNKFNGPSKSKKNTSSKKESNNEIELMNDFLVTYRITGSVNESIKSAGISQMQYHSWCKDGRNYVSRNTIYFVNEIDKINGKTVKINPIIINANAHNKIDKIKGESVKINPVINNKNKHSEISKKNTHNAKSKRNIFPIKESKKEKKLMNDFLRKYRKTRSVNESIKSAGISQMQYDSWCNDGKNFISRNAMDFVNEIDKINRKPKLNPVTNPMNQNKGTIKKSNHNAKPERNISPRKKSRNINHKPKLHPVINTIDEHNETSKKNTSNSEYSKTQTEKMEMIINCMLKGKTRAQAANCASVSVSQVNKWYNDGRNAKDNEVIKFYKRIRDIESYIYNNAQEKRTMNRVLNYLKMGKTYDEAASYVHINPDLICKWRREGINKENPNSVYFYTHLEKINTNSNEFKSDINTTILDNAITFDEKQKEKMDIVLTYLKQGKSMIESSKLANIPMKTINKWYSQGSNNYSDNTAYFYNRVNIIQYDSKKELDNMNSVLNKIDRPLDKITSIDINLVNSWLEDGRNNISQNTIYFYNEYLKIENELQKMGKFLELQKEGKDKIEACELVGISLSKLSYWIDQGRLGKNSRAIYFVEEYDKLNPHETSEEYISITKKRKFCPNCGNEIEYRQKFCHNCGYRLIRKGAGKLSIFDKIRNLF